jgi:cytochrome b561
MPLRNTLTDWGSLARLLHWIIAVLLVLQFALAWTADEMPEESAQRLTLIVRHVSFGITVLALAIVRILWRFGNPTPAPPVGARRWEISISHATHGILYLLLLVIPISGFLMSAAHGDPVSWFGLQLPALVSKGAAIGRPAHETHEILSNVLLAIVGLHVLAALKHHFITHNDVLRRMRPW